MKRLIFIITIIFFFFIIYNLSESIFGLWQKQELLVNAKKELVKEKKANNQLKQQISSIKQPDYIEAQARDKLLLVKPGEQFVVLPGNLIVDNLPSSENSERHLPIWKQWLALFLP